MLTGNIANLNKKNVNLANSHIEQVHNLKLEHQSEIEKHKKESEEQRARLEEQGKKSMLAITNQVRADLMRVD